MGLSIGQGVVHAQFGHGRVVYATDQSVGVRFHEHGLKAFRPPEDCTLVEDAGSVAIPTTDEFWAFAPATEWVLDNREHVFIYATATEKSLNKLLNDHLTILDRELDRRAVLIATTGWHAYSLKLRLTTMRPDEASRLRFPGALCRHSNHGYGVSHNRYCWYLLRQHGFSIWEKRA